MKDYIVDLLGGDKKGQRRFESVKHLPITFRQYEEVELATKSNSKWKFPVNERYHENKKDTIVFIMFLNIQQG